jgi:hypothetical protein
MRGQTRRRGSERDAKCFGPPTSSGVVIVRGAGPLSRCPRSDQCRQRRPSRLSGEGRSLSPARPSLTHTHGHLQCLNRCRAARLVTTPKGLLAAPKSCAAAISIRDPGWTLDSRLSTLARCGGRCRSLASRSKPKGSHHGRFPPDEMSGPWLSSWLGRPATRYYAGEEQRVGWP